MHRVAKTIASVLLLSTIVSCDLFKRESSCTFTVTKDGLSATYTWNSTHPNKGFYFISPSWVAIFSPAGYVSGQNGNLLYIKLADNTVGLHTDTLDGSTGISYYDASGHSYSSNGFVLGAYTNIWVDSWDSNRVTGRFEAVIDSSVSLSGTFTSLDSGVLE